MVISPGLIYGIGVDKRELAFGIEFNEKEKKNAYNNIILIKSPGSDDA